MDVSVIKQAVSMSAACETYGIKINRHGFSNCPLHGNDDTPSFKIYPDDRGFYCFGCSKGGDVIKFVQLLFQLNFKAAVAKLNANFCLGLDRPVKYSDYRKAKRAERERKQRKADAERHNEQYWTLLSEYIRLDRNMRLYKPIQGDTELNPLFAEALYKIQYIKYQLDYFEFQEVS